VTGEFRPLSRLVRLRNMGSADGPRSSQVYAAFLRESGRISQRRSWGVTRVRKGFGRGVALETTKLNPDSLEGGVPAVKSGKVPPVWPRPTHRCVSPEKCDPRRQSTLLGFLARVPVAQLDRAPVS
jgi:hypothetical protein